MFELLASKSNRTILIRAWTLGSWCRTAMWRMPVYFFLGYSAIYLTFELRLWNLCIFHFGLASFFTCVELKNMLKLRPTKNTRSWWNGFNCIYTRVHCMFQIDCIIIIFVNRPSIFDYICKLYKFMHAINFEKVMIQYHDCSYKWYPRWFFYFICFLVKYK